MRRGDGVKSAIRAPALAAGPVRSLAQADHGWALPSNTLWKGFQRDHVAGLESRFKPTGRESGARRSNSGGIAVPPYRPAPQRWAQSIL